DPARVPAGGVRARCSYCQAAFRLTPQGPQRAAPRVASSAGGGGAAVASAVPATAPGWAGEMAPMPAPGGLPFGAQDPHTRALRIARALVSDIVAYHSGRRDQSLAKGSLRHDFREEILKSWEEYVAQVGVDVAKTTPYFRDALNETLAKGQNIF
ncbi:MAG: hypothetical protein ACRELD_00505, partial [Longimicrobiales bacterium]